VLAYIPQGPQNPEFPGKCVKSSRASSIHIDTRKASMNWDRIEGNWKQLKGKVREQWGKITDDDFDTIAGKREQLAGKIQETYGIGKDEAEKQISDFESKARRENWLQ
jgi:uncharacterized protein YjbJ (UPF0337 family)